MREMTAQFGGKHLLFIATNQNHVGIPFQQTYWDTPEAYMTVRGLAFEVYKLGLVPIQQGFYDAPFWPDLPLTGDDHAHLRVKDRLVVNLTVLERFKLFQKFRSHHVYCLARR